jgi:hypothetical protein
LPAVPTPILFSTQANGAISGAGESTPVACPAPDPGLLVDGDNVLAAEVHQVLDTSSDISFNLELIADLPVGAPDQPTLISPLDGATNVSLSPELRVNVTDPELDALDVTFYGRLDGGAPPPEDFTIIHIGDTQHYSQSYPATFTAITQWIRDNQATRNIVFVSASGDLVNTGSDTNQWDNADAAYDLLEPAILPDLLDGVPFGCAPGNHDMDSHGNPEFTQTYNDYFGIERFCPSGNCRSYYGGNFDGTDNDNNYELFSAGGMDFIVIHMEYNTSPPTATAERAWADGLLQTFSDRRAIITSHYLMEIGEGGAFSAQGQAIFNDLLDRPNLFLMLAGHKHGEGKRLDTAAGGDVWSMVANYQDEPNGGNGWIRILEFSPVNDEIRVFTWSATLQQFQTDADSQFVLSYDMEGGPPFVNLGTVSGVPSGSDAFLTWPGLTPGAEYEWYVEVSDGTTTTTGPDWTFVTQCSVDGDCDDGNVCTLDTCNAGTCDYTDDDGLSCDDGDFCTTTDECSAGSCAGTAVSCPVGQACDPANGLCIADPITETFEQGVGGYAGTFDTYLASDSPTADNSAATSLDVNLSPESHTLLRFEQVFQSEGGPIPDGAIIDSSTLTVNVTDASAQGASLHRMLQPWNDTETWNFWVNGIQAADVEAVTKPDVSSSSAAGSHAIDVTPRLAAWSNGSTNLGWA